MDFEKDILISYAHIDDESVRGDGEGWITEFHRSLEIRLAQLLGEKPKIWRDLKLQGNDYFADEIVDQFPNIALLVSILSPRYVNSEWCNKEVNEFVKVANENIGLRVKNKSRIFKVIKTPIALEQHPEPVRDLLGYEFFKLDHDTGRAKEFSKLFGSEMEEAYWTRLNDLAYDIVSLLSEMRGLAADKSAAEGEEKPIVYLSQSSYDLKEFRENIKRELNENGYHVVPDHHLPTVAPELEADVKSMLNSSQLAIHLVGGNYGLVPEGSDKSIIALQNEIAADHTKESDLQRVIWFVPNSGVDDPRQELFIEELHNSAELQRGAEVIESSLEDVKHTVLTKLKRMEEEARKAREKEQGQGAEKASQDQVGGVDEPKTVYLICDQEDLDGIMDVEDYLFDHGFNVIIPVFDGDESDVRLDHQENLKTCDACLIYYGAGNELWMRAKQRDLMKIAGYGREKPLAVSAVYMAPPADPRKDRFRALNTIVINGQGGFSGDIMNDFVEKLKNA